MRSLVGDYKSTAIYFDAETEKFTCLPQGCSKERSADCYAAMRGEIDAAERRRNQPKRYKTKHFVQWFDPSHNKVVSTYFVGCRSGKGDTEQAFYFKDDDGHTVIRKNYCSNDLLVLPLDCGGDKIAEVMLAKNELVEAHRKYSRLVEETFNKVEQPYLGWNMNVEELNNTDDEFIELLKKAQEGA